MTVGAAPTRTFRRSTLVHQRRKASVHPVGTYSFTK